MRVRIEKCTNLSYWYHKYIGHTFQINLNMKEGKFEVESHTDGCKNILLINPDDCTLIDEE